MKNFYLLTCCVLIAFSATFCAEAKPAKKTSKTAQKQTSAAIKNAKPQVERIAVKGKPKSLPARSLRSPSAHEPNEIENKISKSLEGKLAKDLDFQFETVGAKNPHDAANPVHDAINRPY